MNDMEKILIELCVPATNVTFDIFIPLLSPVYEILELLKKAVNILLRGQYQADKTSILCYETGEIININLSVYELGIHTGSKLMLV